MLPQRIAAYDRLSGLNAIIGLNPSALSDAAAKDQELMQYMESGEELPPLFCVPTLVKDLYVPFHRTLISILAPIICPATLWTSSGAGSVP